ncbi:MAG: arsenite methyltransferase [Planctomycetes bacterium]|nr:arsenite methyltransferase [Planctomycetota bacterium]
MEAKDQERVRAIVREGYGQIAEAEPGTGGCCGPVGGCGVRTDVEELAQKIGYSVEELRALPEGANLGLSCGNPGAIAALQAGEIVLDLGAGAGFDCFLIGPKVGAQGRAIGVDMTAEMLTKARRNLAAYRARTGLDNVEFRLGEIEHLPLADASVDVVISNCVLNLSPDKAQVWREIARVLKPGGRVAVSDLGLVRVLPEAVRESVEALVGCVAGAPLVTDTEQWMRAAGLVAVRITPKPEYVAAMQDVQDPLYQRVAAALPAGHSISDYVASFDIQARKGGPRAKTACC